MSFFKNNWFTAASRLVDTSKYYGIAIVEGSQPPVEYILLELEVLNIFVRSQVEEELARSGLLYTRERIVFWISEGDSRETIKQKFREKVKEREQARKQSKR